ncbi:MAG: putative metal-dependent hydrolase [Candidatus Hydrogenedentes bacterium]|nr:putative metal-dependent hydrolase [Candidatus Hydrogenedentota bacterium]
MSDPRYPIGRFDRGQEITPEKLAGWKDDVAALPAQLRAAVAGLNDAQLDTPYREDGWTLRQVVHHLADSHMNAYIRFKLALTEESPTIKPYFEERWAEQQEARTAPIDVSLDLIDALHARWSMALRNMSDPDFNRTFVHPESGLTRLDVNLGIYSWHGRHHVAHITTTREREGC